MKKKILVCVQRDIKNTISWALKDLSVVIPQYFDHTYQIEKLFESDTNFCGIIIDSQIDGESTIPFLKTIRDKSNIKILLIISAETPKQEIVKLIQDKMVDNVILRPFNANQIVDGVAKLCGIQRATEKPWYMYTKPE
ncbi:MAG: response regulator [Thermodesulfovibrio sp.]|jgi:DNA-binding NtrC family response regulator|uniref:response regulator n=1 Tax=unclassified Thermodesulfovibrio TaxID=2645936 RepID=UPI00083A2E8C|nr:MULTISPECIES: response regulator [unclassified Thermodesulfovibrio]MDI1471357.1 response regulator [Thermodesulfovibrio sp. 1176]MDI6714616.1 response regulator [Thermodesulfovibrio sp.]ODA44311.1 hypothetical protein THER_0935 [Thermodesulfovibrio sp. N1]